MEFIDDEEISELFSRLLEMLRQAGVDHHSNNYHFVYVASGAQYVKNQYLEKPLQSLRHKENEKDHTPKSVSILIRYCLPCSERAITRNFDGSSRRGDLIWSMMTKRRMRLLSTLSFSTSTRLGQSTSIWTSPV